MYFIGEIFKVGEFFLLFFFNFNDLFNIFVFVVKKEPLLFIHLLDWKPTIERYPSKYKNLESTVIPI